MQSENGKAAPTGGSPNSSRFKGDGKKRIPPSPKKRVHEAIYGNDHVSPKPPELLRLPGLVWSAWNAGRVVIPQYLKSSGQKASCIDSLARFDDRNLTYEELVEAASRNWAFWAFRLGKQSGLFALDFDERHGGMETYRRLGIQGHTSTPRKGRHIYVRHPGERVRSIGQPGPDGFEGMEVLGDKRLVTFYSKLDQYPYKRHDLPMYSLADLPSELAAVITEPPQAGKKSRRASNGTGVRSPDRIPGAVRAILDKLGDTVKETRPGQWEGLCPLHDDNEPSFGFSIGASRLIVMSCKACDASIEDFADYFGLPLWEFSRTTPLDNNSAADSRPSIVVNGMELPSLVAEAEDALVAANDPPKVFVRGDVPVRIIKGEFGYRTDHFKEATLRVRLSEVARWEKVTKEQTVVIRPDKDVISYLLEKKEYERLPLLDRIVEAPFLAPDGSLVLEQGYYPVTRTYLMPAPGLENLRPPPRITPAMRRRALRFLLDELLIDFPFASDEDKVNAVSLFLLPFVREVINGLVPAYLFEAPKPGSGKGLLAEALLNPAIGTLATTPEKGSAEEYRKEITSQLLRSPSVICFDNLTGEFGSGALAAALTARVWKDRILTISRDMEAVIRNLWVLTGNNLKLTGDMPRRIVLIRLVPRVERPEERPATDFRHPELLKWVAENRRKLVLAALFLCRAWVQEGMPRVSEPVMGSYEDYSRTMGGILQVCELEGFLGNRSSLIATANPEEAEMAAFLKAWHTRFGPNSVLAREVANELESSSALSAVCPTRLTPYLHSDRLTKQLGYVLRSARDGVFKGYQLQADIRSGHSGKWWVKKVEGRGK